MKDTNEAIIVEQTFSRPVDKVWGAITSIEEMRQWFFDNIKSFKPEVGFETRFNVQSGNRNFPHLWKLTEVVPLKKIMYNWKYGGYPGDSTVTFELFEQHEQTMLRLTHTGMESFPEDIPEFSRESCTEGWNYLIKGSLKEYLEGSSE